MSNPPRFCDVKIQFIHLMTLDDALSDAAFRVACYLLVSHADHVTGECHPSQKTIAEALSRSPKSIKRALKVIETSGYFNISPGKYIGHSSRYKPTNAMMKHAVRLRYPTDKSAPLSESSGGQIGPKRGKKLSRRGEQKRPPNRVYEPRTKKSRASECDLGRIEQPHSDHARDQGLTFVSGSSPFAREWDDWLEEHGYLPLRVQIDQQKVNGMSGYWVPTRRPVQFGHPLWERQVKFFAGRAQVRAGLPQYERNTGKPEPTGRGSFSQDPQTSAPADAAGEPNTTPDGNNSMTETQHDD